MELAAFSARDAGIFLGIEGIFSAFSKMQWKANYIQLLKGLVGLQFTVQ